MMKKLSNENIICKYCSEKAEPNTYPPVCKKHMKLNKKASAKPQTLRDFEDNEDIWKA